MYWACQPRVRVAVALEPVLTSGVYDKNASVALGASPLYSTRRKHDVASGSENDVLAHVPSFLSATFA